MKVKKISRRTFLKAGSGAAFVAAGAVMGCKNATIESFLQQRFYSLSERDKADIISRLEKEYEETYGKKFTVSSEDAHDGVKFGYGLDLSRCIGCRRCVYACVKENNQSRDPQLHWITVLEMEKIHGIDLTHADPYYNPKQVPREDHFYMPVACHQCENPPCTKVCPVKATWKDRDGIVIIDYNWCIGCRCCMSACPYSARHFNWKQPSIPQEELNTSTHYFGNRPRYKGVVEKCSFCIQRTRKGLYPACVEICPVGARKFGNLLDSNSEIRYLIENKRVFIFKEELNTNPKFYYFYAT